MHSHFITLPVNPTLAVDAELQTRYSCEITLI